MGKGDKKTAKGKRSAGSHGNARAQTNKKPAFKGAVAPKSPVARKVAAKTAPVKTAAAKAPAKKAPAKKAADKDA